MPDDAVAVVGAGNVGCALAADMAVRGFDVWLFNRSPERIRAIQDAGGITANGVVEGFGRVRVTTSLREAVADAGIVAVTVPTSSLPSYARDLVTAIRPEQLLWLNPGHTGGALYLAAEAARQGVDRPTICQLSTASHISRVTGPAAVRVFLLARAAVGTLPAGAVDDCCARLDALLPGQFERATSILEVDLANINALMHPPGMICNAGWIEATGGEFGFYRDGTKQAVSAVIAAIDRERLAIADGLKVPAIDFVALFQCLGFIPSDLGPATTVAEAIAASELIHPIQAPPLLNHRYIHEDVAWGLVPWMHLAHTVGCETTAIEALVELGSVINGIDYKREGLTLERMGLHGLSGAEIRRVVSA